MDLTAGTAAGLPRGSGLIQVDQEPDRTVLYFQSSAPSCFCPSASPGPARSPEGEWHVTEGGSGTDQDTGLETEDLHLIGYPWDQVTLTLNWTRFSPLDVSLTLPAVE